MNRLTERFDVITAIDKDGNETHSKGIQIKDKQISLAYEKLFQLENIEEELGIDLKILQKAKKQMYIYVKNCFGKITSHEIASIDLYCGVIIYYIQYQPKRQYMYQELKEYGKTWALTKEELL